MRAHSLRKIVASAGFAGMVLLAPAAGVANEDVAKATFAEATELVEQARQTDSLSERWTFYETARAYLSQIRDSLSGTDLARRLGDEATTEGALYENVKRELLLTGKAVCERNLTAACILRFARDVLRIINPVSGDDFLVDVAKSQAAVGDVAGAFATIETVHSISYREALPPIMTAMVKTGDLAEALAKAKGFPRRRDRDVALSSIVRALAEKGDVANGGGVAAQIGEAGARSLAVATLAGSSPLEEEGHDPSVLFAEALGLAETVDDAKARAKLLFKIAEIQLTVDNNVGARETFVAAFAAARAISDPRGRYHLLNAGYRYSNAELSDSARAVKDEFRKTAAQIDETRNPIDDPIDDARAKIKSGDIAGAKESLRQAREMVLEIESADSRNFNLYRIIKLRSMIGDIDGALADWALMPSPSRDASYSRAQAAHARDPIARALAKAGDIEGLNGLLETVDDQLERDSLLLWQVIPSLAENGWTGEAHRFAGELVELSWRLSQAMVVIAKGEAAVGDFEAALATAGSITQRNDRAKAFSEIAVAHFNKGRQNEAKKLLMMAFREMFGPGGILSGKRSVYSSDLQYISVFDSEAFKKIGEVLAEIETRN